MKHFSFLRHALVLVPLCAVGHLSVHAQGVGIGTTAPDASAALDIVSTTKGALLPRVANATGISNPATGLIVFQTGGTPGYYYNSGTPGAPSWQQLVTSTQLSAVNTSIGILNAQTATLNTQTTTLNAQTASLTTSVNVLNAKTTATDANVASLASSAVLSASNGLTKSGQTVALGGTLTAATTIAQGGNNFNLTGGNVGIGTSAPSGLLEVYSPSTAFNGPDQSQLDQSSNFGLSTYYQTFVPGLSGTLQQFNTYSAGIITSNQYAPVNATVDLFLGTTPTGAALGTQAVTLPAYAAGVPFPATAVVFSPAPTLTAGQTYCIRFTRTGGATYLVPALCPSNCYANGAMSTNNAWDATFQTIMNVSGTPAQSALLVKGLNVGIGTTAPSQKLEVAGQIFSNTGGFRFPDNTVQTTATTTGAAGPQGTAGPAGPVGTTGPAGSNATVTASNGLTAASGNVTLGGTLAAATTIAQGGNNFSLTGGNVGIGTTAPAQALDVAGNIQSSANIAVDYNNTNAGTVANILRFGPVNSGEGIGSRRTSGGNQYGIDFYTNSTNRMTVTVAGNVGIGTTTPSQALDVALGSVRVGSFTAFTGVSTTNQGAHLQWNRTGGDGETWLINHLGGGSSNAGIRFAGITTATGTVPTEWARFLNNGNFGIGTTAPATKLDVNGNFRLAVRTIPVNTTTSYALVAADIAFSIFKVTDGAFSPSITLPPSGTGQVAGQELTVYSTAAANSCVINSTNTDNATTVTIVARGVNGIHAVKYIWDADFNMWVRVQ